MTVTSPVQMIIPATRELASCIAAAFEAAGDPMQVITGAEKVVKEDDFIMVAAPSNAGAGVLLDVAASDQGHAQAWTATIVVLLSTWSGTLSVSTRLDRIQQMLDTVCDAIAQNPRLGGTVAVADIGSTGQLATFNDEDGVAAEIGLTVRCEIY